MRLGYHAPWEYYPKNLYFEEVQNPYVVLNEFFGSWPDSHKRELKQWKKVAVGNTYFKGKPHGPAELLFTWEQVIRLIEACYLLWITRKISNLQKEDLITRELLEKAKEKWIYFPDDLSEQELLNPYLVLKEIYKYMSVQKYRDHLKDWLYAALYNHPLDDERILSEMKRVYHNLCRLYSAAWMIQQIEGTWTRVKSEYMEQRYHEATAKEMAAEEAPAVAEERI